MFSLQKLVHFNKCDCGTVSYCFWDWTFICILKWFLYIFLQWCEDRSMKTLIVILLSASSDLVLFASPLPMLLPAWPSRPDVFPRQKEVARDSGTAKNIRQKMVINGGVCIWSFRRKENKLLYYFYNLFL